MTAARFRDRVREWREEVKGMIKELAAIHKEVMSFRDRSASLVALPDGVRRLVEDLRFGLEDSCKRLHAVDYVLTQLIALVEFVDMETR